MHTDQTLEIMDDITTEVGAEFRAFADDTCSAFDTRELPRETAARKRRKLKKTKGKNTLVDSAPESSMDLSANAAKEADGPLPKKYSLQIYKYHCLGDYPNMIRRFGTCDSYSTEPVRGMCLLRDGLL